MLRIKGYAVVQLLPQGGYHIDSYYFNDAPAVRANAKMRELNKQAGRKEYGVFAAIYTPEHTGLWFEENGSTAP